MTILLIGASGTIGRAVHQALAQHHKVITANYQSDSDLKVDLNDHASIKHLFEQAGKVDAIVCTAGNGQLLPLSQHKDEDFDSILHNKLMGQINLFRYGQPYLSQGGSVTLTTGTASRAPMPGTSSISMATAALEAFVKAASLELTDVRLNAVSPGFVKESMEQFGFDSSQGISAADTAKAYVTAVEGDYHGQVLDTHHFV